MKQLVVALALSLVFGAHPASSEFFVVPVIKKVAVSDLNWRGEWTGVGEAYVVGDIVEYLGSSFICVEDHSPNSGNSPPGSGWELMALRGGIGPQGPKGDTGDTGAQGAAGVAGPTGPQGPKGDTGDTGAQGAAGVAGPTGPQGPKGDTGDTGAQGPAGVAGPTGPQGPKGDTGDTGAQGPAGVAGPSGPQGPKGDTGDTGAQGPAGPQGPPGDNVLSGYFPNVTDAAYSDGFADTCVVGELKLFAGVVGAGLKADGRTLAVAQYSALFSLIGTRYGGNGTTHFDLPDMTPVTPVGTQWYICDQGIYPTRP